MRKSLIESLFLVAVLLTHIAAFLIIWLFGSFDTATVRQDLTLIIAPVTAAYFLAGVRFAIRNQNRASTDTSIVNWPYVFTVVLVTVAFLGAVLWVLIGYGTQTVAIAVDDIKIVVGAIETFIGAAFALVAEDIFQEKIGANGGAAGGGAGGGGP